MNFFDEIKGFRNLFVENQFNTTLYDFKKILSVSDNDSVSVIVNSAIII